MSRYGDQLRTIQGGDVAPVYLLAGSDPYLQDNFTAEVARHFLPEGVRKQVYSVDDDRIDDLLSGLKAYDLFGGRELLVLLQAQRIAGHARDELLAYAASPHPEKCLVLVLEDYQPGKGLHKALAKQVPVIDTRPPFPDQLIILARNHARSRGHSIEADALEQLIEAAGDSAGHVTSELDKLFSGLADGEKVTREMVTDQVRHNMAYHLWHLQEALARRDLAGALRILMRLLNYGADGPRIVQALTVLFTQLLYLQSDTRAKNVYTGLNKSVAATLPQMRRLYRPAESPGILKQLLQADLQLKSTSTAPATVLVPLIIGIASQSP